MPPQETSHAVPGPKDPADTAMRPDARSRSRHDHTTTSAPTARSDPGRGDFDLQAHRGGRGLVVESTLAGFANALELGVSTLELDVQLTRDRYVVVSHDRWISDVLCRDTHPAFPGDPAYPYVGRFITHLTLDQLRTLDCGSRVVPEHPWQRRVPGARMALLSEVFDLVKRYRADQVRFNIETKVHASAPEETASREDFVQAVAREVHQAQLCDRVTIQSFDWGALMRMREVEPRLPLVALTNGDFLHPEKPGMSAWLGGLNAADFPGDLVGAVSSFGADALSPVYGIPRTPRKPEGSYTPITTPELVYTAHEAGLSVIPWTVNDTPMMETMLDTGVDGLITDYPDRLRTLMHQRRMPLPRAYPGPDRATSEPRV